MSLRGNLADFPAVEVLQLLALQEKTGILRLYGERRREALVFERGLIVSTWDRTLTSIDPLKAHVLKKGALPEHLIHKALRLEARAEYSFMDILLREGMVDPSTVESHVKELVKEVVSDLLSWDKGRFDFSPEVEVPRYLPDCAIKVESILLEAAQSIDEEAEATKSRLPGIPKTISQVTVVNPLKPSHRAIALHGLFLILMPMVAFGASLILKSTTPIDDKPVFGLRVAEYGMEREVRNLRILLEMYNALHGRYPTTLNALVLEGFLDVGRLSELLNHEVQYRVLESGSRYFLYSRSYAPLARTIYSPGGEPAILDDLPKTMGSR